MILDYPDKEGFYFICHEHSAVWEITEVYKMNDATYYRSTYNSSGVLLTNIQAKWVHIPYPEENIEIVKNALRESIKYKKIAALERELALLKGETKNENAPEMAPSN